MGSRFSITISIATCALLSLPVTGWGGEPSAIDRIIEQRLEQEKVPASPLADDAEFLRRVYLDVTGRIPTCEQAVAFLDSKEPDRRAKLIDELLARPEYGFHFANIWRDLIVDRSSEQSQVRQLYSWEFVNWLADNFNKGKGWDDIVAEMLTAEGAAKENPAATFIMANRMNEFPRPEDLVGMAGKLFMGVNIRCAQCHDHPQVEEWKQDDFWGMAAFFGQLRDHGMGPNGVSRNPAFFEGPNPDEKKETSYVKRMQRAGLVPPQEGPQIGIPTIADPAKVERLVQAKYFLDRAPTLSEKDGYRSRLAGWMTSPENPYFAKAAVNRLWAHFLGQGIVNPVDDMSPARTPSHPELLALLEKEFRSSGFDYRHVIRLICNSTSYQRTSKPLAENKDDDTLFSRQAIKLLSADQTVDSLSIAIGRTPPAGKNRDRSTEVFATREADDPSTDFSHGIPQFLHQMNAGLANSPPSILNKLTTGKSNEEAVANLYLAALSRRPRPEETQRMLGYLEKVDNPRQGYLDIYWVLLNSAEFILNR